MRILVAHCAYRLRGGEDAVVDAEVELLRDAGHEVELLLRHNDELEAMPTLQAAVGAVWSRRTRREARERVERFRPDVVHAHNLFPLLSPSLYAACADAGVPVVQTLHNFRLACPQAMFLRDGRICEDCIGRAPVPAIRHGCYRGSRAQTAVVAAMVTVHRALGTWQHAVTRYIALNEFCRRKFIQAGLPEERIMVKPNFVASPEPTAGPRNGFLFVGRLSAEKGVNLLLEAWQRHDAAGQLKVAGTGPLSGLLDGARGVVPLGQRSLAEVQSLMGRARALVLPSLWYENFPRTLVEAFGAGLPVIASRLGALSELVREGETGLLFEPGRSDDLAERLAWAQAHPEAMARMGRNARAVYETEYTPRRNLQQLLAIYAAALGDARPAATDAATASPASH